MASRMSEPRRFTSSTSTWSSNRPRRPISSKEMLYAWNNLRRPCDAWGEFDRRCLRRVDRIGRRVPGICAVSCASRACSATFSRTTSAACSTAYLRVSTKNLSCAECCQSRRAIKVATLLPWSRRRLKISAAMLIIKPLAKYFCLSVTTPIERTKVMS